MGLPNNKFITQLVHPFFQEIEAFLKELEEEIDLIGECEDIDLIGEYEEETNGEEVTTDEFNRFLKKSEFILNLRSS